MKNKEENFLTWFQINNILPIIASAVMIATSFAMLNTKISVLETKLDNMIVLLKSQQEQEFRLITDLNDVHQRLAIVETKINGK